MKVVATLRVLLLGWATSYVAACATTTNTSRGGNPDHGTTEGGPAVATGSGGSGSSATNGGASGLVGFGAEPNSGPPTVVCNWVELQPQVCATLIGDWADGGSQPMTPNGFETQLEGTVTDILSGSPPCSSNGYPNYVSTWYARIWDGVRGLEMGLPTASPIVTVGEVLSATLTRYQPNGFAPLKTFVEVRTSDGRLLFWQAASGGIETLQMPPEVQVSAGPIFCNAQEECGSWQALFMEMKASGWNISLGPGRTAQIGEYTVAAGGIANDTTYPSPCADWYVAIASALAVRTPFANLSL